MGTMFFPISLSLVSIERSLIKDIVVETFLSPVPFKSSLKIDTSGTFNFSGAFDLEGKKPPSFFL